MNIKKYPATANTRNPESPRRIATGNGTPNGSSIIVIIAITKQIGFHEDNLMPLD
jgi:hypothetical protein